MESDRVVNVVKKKPSSVTRIRDNIFLCFLICCFVGDVGGTVFDGRSEYFFFFLTRLQSTIYQYFN